MVEKQTGSEVLQAGISKLIPESLVRVARDPSQVELISHRHASDELDFTIVEHNYGGQTDQIDWDKWVAAMKAAEKEEDELGISFLPDRPATVDRLHAAFIDDIENSRLLLSDRILLTCKLRIQTGDENVLYVGSYDGEKGLGIAMEFYKQTLPKVAKELGIRFIAGQNDQDNIPFFIKKLGRYTYSELTADAKKKLFPYIDPNSKSGLYTTVQFLEQDDIRRYVQDEFIRLEA